MLFETRPILTCGINIGLTKMGSDYPYWRFEVDNLSDCDVHVGKIAKIMKNSLNSSVVRIMEFDSSINDFISLIYSVNEKNYYFG